MNPRVSVVVPAFNNAKYLALTIDSILLQDYADYELIIADHSSIDSTSSILSGYSNHPKVRILSPTPPGGGAAANWNRVSNYAKGELLKLVCGDDLLAPSSLREQVAAFDANPSAVLVASSRNLIDAGGQLLVRNRGLAKLDGRISGKAAIRAAILAGTNIFGEPICVMFRRDIFELEKGWDDTFPYLIDQTTYTRIMLHGDVIAIRKPLASFRISNSQWSVRLVGQHACQTIAFHQMLRMRHPDIATFWAITVGNIRSILLDATRRAVYYWLRNRM